MKEAFLIFSLILLSAAVFAAPFGLKMGMTLEEITEQCEEVPEYLEDDIYLIKPIKNHPAFTFYAVYVSEKVGL